VFGPLRELVDGRVDVRTSDEHQHQNADRDRCNRQPSLTPVAECDRRWSDRKWNAEPDERQTQNAKDGHDETGTTRIARPLNDEPEQQRRSHQDNRRADQERRRVFQSRIVTEKVINRHRRKPQTDSGTH
jgi:hypothetical protein